MKMKFIFIIYLLLYSITTYGEYRVYQYMIKHKVFLPQDTDSYIVTSTLDTVSYLAYHGGSSILEIDLLRSWKCLGYTGKNTPICLSPYDTLSLNDSSAPATLQGEL